MKKFALMFAMMLSCTGAAIAACPGNGYLSGSRVSSLLSGQTACSPANCIGSGSSANCQWQETHQGIGAGSLIEQHTGAPGDPVETVGSWSVSANTGIVTHNYGAGGSYPYSVNDNKDGTYSFCGSNGEFRFTVKVGRC